METVVVRPFQIELLHITGLEDFPSRSEPTTAADPFG